MLTAVIMEREAHRQQDEGAGNTVCCDSGCDIEKNHRQHLAC